METLFRFVLNRPAVVQREDAPSIDLTQPTDFQTSLIKASREKTGRASVQAVCRKFVTTARFIGDPKSLPIAAELEKLDLLLRALEGEVAADNAAVRKAIEEAFGTSADKLVTEKVLDEPAANLRDTILAIKYLPAEHNRDIEALTNQLRLIELVQHAVADSTFPASGEALQRYRRRSVKLPDLAAPGSSISTRPEREKGKADRKGTLEARRKQIATMQKDLIALRSAVAELTTVGGDQFQVTPQSKAGGFMVAENLRPLRAFELEMTQRQRNLERNDDRTDDLVEANKLPFLRFGDRLSMFEETGLNTAAIGPRSFLEAGTALFQPENLTEITFRARPAVLEALSGETRQVLEARKMQIDAEPYDRIVQRLDEESQAIVQQLDGLLAPPMQRGITRIGDAYVSILTPAYEILDPALLPPDWYILPPDMRIPHTHGSIKPAGIADLLVVKQQLTGYEGADVAHIENVLKGERKEREHMRRRETEELTFTEVEITTTEERELESTNRFEMSRETQETIKEDVSLKAQLSVSGKYGPMVEFSASAEGSMSRSREESTKAASTFSQDVTERSSRKVTERVLERSSLRVTNEVTEKNSHLLDNQGGAGNIAGVYQWVNKTYQAQMFNYGLRTLYDFMVPEPAAYLIASMLKASAHAVELEKPSPFTLRPDQITESNYHTYVARYGATDVAPPPEIYRTKSFDFHAGDGDDKKDYHHSGQVALDDGYMAIWGRVGVTWNQWESSGVLDMTFGGRTHRFQDGGGWVWSTSLDSQRDSVPFAFKTWKWSDVALAGEVKCQRTDRAMTKWRLETHAKITTAYQGKLADYEEKLAALQMQAGVAIEGQNPAANLEVMRDELKKHCLSILTDQHFDLFDAVEYGSTGLPQVDLFENEGEGPYVRFFEQAFEWEHMTWITYPYFWGRKSEWESRIAYEDPDPVFNEFLKAGYCRVVVPARLGFEGAIDHFVVTGDIWSGGPLPVISDPDYLPIADEIAERLERPGDEIPQGDPWTVRMPTTLVYLRPDDKLPKWKQDAATGEWVEA